MKRRRCRRKNAAVASLICTYTDFAENTSIHGLKYTVQNETTTFEKILWVLIVCLGVAGSGFMLSLFWQRFTSNPTRTSVQTTYAPTTEIPFPGITICNINRLITSKVDHFFKKLDLHDSDKGYMRNIFPQILAYAIPYPYNISDLEALHDFLDANELGGIKRVIKGTSQGCREMLVKCKWESKIIDCRKYFVDTFTPDGLCCSFNYDLKSDDTISTLYFGFHMGLTILLDPMVQEEQYSSLYSNGMKVTIHHPRNYPGFGNTEKILATGRETLLQLDGTRYVCSDEVRSLTPQQRGCVTSDEYSLGYFSQYSEENCITECRANYVVRKCGCLPYYYTFSDKPVCDITKIPCLAELRDPKNGSRFQNSYCGCPMQCEDIFYDVLSTSTKFVDNEYLTSSFLFDVNTTENTMLLHVFFSSQTQTILLRDTLTSAIYLLSSFGGIFSLFLGCSFISGAEIIYYACIRFFLNLRALNKIETKPDDIHDKPFKGRKMLRPMEVAHGNFKGQEVYTIYGNNVFLN